jgi:hypothetical protein
MERERIGSPAFGGLLDRSQVANLYCWVRCASREKGEMTLNVGRHSHAVKPSGSKGKKDEGGRRDLLKSHEKRREKSGYDLTAFWEVIYIFENLDQSLK